MKNAGFTKHLSLLIETSVFQQFPKSAKKTVIIRGLKKSFFVMTQVALFSAIEIENPGDPARPFLRHQNITFNQ